LSLTNKDIIVQTDSFYQSALLISIDMFDYSGIFDKIPGSIESNSSHPADHIKVLLQWSGKFCC